jgi:hypothetical protein
MTIGLPTSTAQINHQFNNEFNLDNDRNSNVYFSSKNICMESNALPMSHNSNTHNKKASNTNSNIKKQSYIFKLDHIYIYLLRLIKFIILFIQSLKLLLNQLSNFMAINYEKLKVKLKNNKSNEVSLFDQNKIVDINDNFIIPKHVCVVLNEIIDNEEIVYEKLFLIAQYMFKLNFEYLSFYQFDGKILFLLLF